MLDNALHACPDVNWCDKIWTEKTIDVKPFIGKGISTALGDEQFFKKVANESGGGIFWPNGYDFCPNFLHDEVPDATRVMA